MQGIWIKKEGELSRRPKSKKEVREMASESPESVTVESYGMGIGIEYEGPLSELPADLTVSFVGPDPHARRNFYGSIERKLDGTLWVS